jgi:flagellar biosynthesis protein FliR
MISQALEALPGEVLAVFLVFCRIGACLLLTPGIGSARVPMQVRLLFALGASAAIYSAIGELEGTKQAAGDTTAIIRLAGLETAKGLFIGFLVRFFFGALQWIAEAASSAIGLGTNQSDPEDGEQVPGITSLITITATVLFFVMDQHLELLRALYQSYSVFAFGAGFGQNGEMLELLKVLSAASLVALQVCSPLIVFSIVVNVLFGILNKLAPMIPVYFISPPFIIGGGLMMLYFISQDFFSVFMTQFSNWLITG